MKRLWWAVMVLGASACAPTVAQGKMLTQLPSGLEWCGREPKKYEWAAARGHSDGLIPASEFQACTPLLQQESWAQDDWSGVVVYGLDTDERGLITSVCVWGGNYGNALKYIECSARKLRESGYVFEMNLRKHPYRLWFVAE